MKFYIKCLVVSLLSPFVIVGGLAYLVVAGVYGGWEICQEYFEG